MDNLLIALFANPLLLILLISCFPLYISGFCLFFGALFPANKETRDIWPKKRKQSLIWGVILIILAMIPSIIVTAVLLHNIGA
ncbi:MAG: hypothetical protein J5617_04325 [Bacilli bacterium]|nr:hypothetical protein [Bacilli bacterium]